MPTALLIDADDTLWENNIYFEQVVDQFLVVTERLSFRRDIVLDTLDDVERRNVQQYGYGADNFVRSLKETLLQLGGSPRDHGLLGEIDELCQSVLHHPIELLDGVEATLRHLSTRHLTILFTKGNPKEQRRKIDKSGLADLFYAIEIAREKDPEAFKDLITRYDLHKECTWMIGNSPKSDINPALEIGINAVYIPHVRTWKLERENLTVSGKLTILESFSDLRQRF